MTKTQHDDTAVKTLEIPSWVSIHKCARTSQSHVVRTPLATNPKGAPTSCPSASDLHRSCVYQTRSDLTAQYKEGDLNVAAMIYLL